MKMKKLISSLFVVAIASASVLAQEPQRSKSTPEERAERTTQKLTSELTLNADQQTQVKALILKTEQAREEHAEANRDRRGEMEEELKRVKLPNIKIALTGGGRVANGAIETLSALRIRKVTPEEFLMATFREPVYCQLNPRDYVERPNDHNFDLNDFK